MTDGKQRRLLWLHAWSRMAIMVSKHGNSWEAKKNEQWLPLSMITVVERRIIQHKLGPDRAKGAPLIIGTLLLVEAPAWLLEQKGLKDDAELPDHGVVASVEEGWRRF